MLRSQLKTLILATTILFPIVAQSATKTILINGESFTDYRVTQKGPEESLKIIQDELGLLFKDALSEYLSPEHQVLIGIVDIDLPGELNPYVRTAGKNLRATGDFRKVRLNFKIVVKDPMGTVMLADAFELRDTSKRPKIRKAFADWKATDLFKRPIQRWAKSTFSKE